MINFLHCPCANTKQQPAQRDQSLSACNDHCAARDEDLAAAQVQNSHVRHVQDSLQFAYQPQVGVEDDVLDLRHCTYSHMDRGGSTVRMLVPDFFSAFNTTQPCLLQDQLATIREDRQLCLWITSYPMDRPQYIRLWDIICDILVSSTGAPPRDCVGPDPLQS